MKKRRNKLIYTPERKRGGVRGFLLWTGYITVARVPPKPIDENEEDKKENEQ